MKNARYYSNLLIDFLTGEDVGYEIDDFLSTTHRDHQTVELQEFVNRVVDNYPSSDGHFVNDEGMKLLKRYVGVE